MGREAQGMAALHRAGWTYDDLAQSFGLSVQQVLASLHPTQRRGGLYSVQLALKVDEEMHGRVVTKAREQRQTVPATLRDLIEWGLEAR